MSHAINHTCHILLVEDNPLDIDLTKRAFSENSSQTVSFDIAQDGEEAIEFISRWNNGAPIPVFILLDLKLPKMDGLDVLKTFKSHPRYRLIPIIVLTSADNSSAEIQSAYKFGANSYIVKTKDFEKFKQVADDVKQYWYELNIQPAKIDF